MEKTFKDLLENHITGTLYFSARNCVEPECTNSKGNGAERFSERMCPYCGQKDTKHAPPARGVAAALSDIGFECADITCGVLIPPEDFSNCTENDLAIRIGIIFGTIYRTALYPVEMFDDLPTAIQYNIPAGTDKVSSLFYVHTCPIESVFNRDDTARGGDWERYLQDLRDARNAKVVEVLKEFEDLLLLWSACLQENGNAAVWRLAGIFEEAIELK